MYQFRLTNAKKNLLEFYCVLLLRGRNRTRLQFKTEKYDGYNRKRYSRCLYFGLRERGCLKVLDMKRKKASSKVTLFVVTF